MELTETKFIINLVFCKEKKDQNEVNSNEKHSHLSLIVLVGHFSVMFHTCQHPLRV